LVSTAYLDEAERCHRVGLLHRGRLLEEGPPERILSRVPGRIFEIEVDEARSARCLIEGVAGVLQIGVFGQRLHVALEGEDALSRVLAALAAAGLDVASFREIAPTLEDAFIAVIGEASEEEAR